MEGGTIALGAATTPALQKLLADPATTAAVLPVVARWDKARGACAPAAEHARAAARRDRPATTVSDDRRVDVAASLLAVPARAPSAGGDRADPRRPARRGSPQGVPARDAGRPSGADADAMLVAAVARTRSTPVFEQIVRRPESAMALLAALEEGTVTPVKLGPTNVARLRTHPNRQVAKRAIALLDTLAPARGRRATSSPR